MGLLLIAISFSVTIQVFPLGYSTDAGVSTHSGGLVNAAKAPLRQWDLTSSGSPLGLEASSSSTVNTLNGPSIGIHETQVNFASPNTHDFGTTHKSCLGGNQELPCFHLDLDPLGAAYVDMKFDASAGQFVWQYPMTFHTVYDPQIQNDGSQHAVQVSVIPGTGSLSAQAGVNIVIHVHYHYLEGDWKDWDLSFCKVIQTCIDIGGPSVAALGPNAPINSVADINPQLPIPTPVPLLDVVFGSKVSITDQGGLINGEVQSSDPKAQLTTNVVGIDNSYVGDTPTRSLFSVALPNDASSSLHSSSPSTSLDLSLTGMSYDQIVGSTITPFLGLSFASQDVFSQPLDFLSFNIPGTTVGLPADQDVPFQMQVAQALPDLALTSIPIKDCTFVHVFGCVTTPVAGDRMDVQYVVTNIGKGIAPGKAVLAFVVYDNGASVSTSFGTDGSDLYPGYTYHSPVVASITLTSGTHTIKVCVNPQFMKIADESNFNNNCNQVVVQVQLPVIVTTTTTTATTPQPFDFALLASPPTLTLSGGQTGTFSIAVYYNGGSQTQAVNLQVFSATTLPNGMTVSLDQTQVTPPPTYGGAAAVATLTVTTVAAPPGLLSTQSTYVLTIVGVSADGTATHQTTVTVVVNNP